MGLIELAADLEQMLHEAGRRLTAANKGDFQRFILFAAADFARVRPRTRRASVTLSADVGEYPAPADLAFVKAATWGTAERRRRKPWADNWPGPLPRLTTFENDDGETALWIDPAPTRAQINALGSTYSFYYVARHQVATDPAGTTVREADRELLLVRAMVFALQELANDNSVKPVRLGDGVGSGPKNGTPAALAKDWYTEFERLAGIAA